MGAIAASLGLGGQGSGFQATNATNPAQLTAAYNQTQQGQQQYQQFLQALQAQNGVQNQSNVYNQLQQVANGQGPNPAQAQLAQATGANVANQAALMAGQRGAGANAGLLARQAAQQGAATQQNAAGQAATLQAQQSLGALNQLSGLSTQQVAQQQGAIQGINQNALQGQQNLIGAQNNTNATNAQVQASAAQNGGLLGGILGGGGTGLTSAAKGIGSLFGAAGGEVPDMPGYAEGGSHDPQANYAMPGKTIDDSGPKSFVGRHMLGMTDAVHGMQGMADGGQYFHDRSDVVPGHAQVKGDSLKNDTVNAKLSPGEIVIPRHITQGEDAPAKAAAFVNAILAKHHISKGKK